jgi:hypothetical protein
MLTTNTTDEKGPKSVPVEITEHKKTEITVTKYQCEYKLLVEA